MNSNEKPLLDLIQSVQTIASTLTHLAEKATAQELAYIVLVQTIEDKGIISSAELGSQLAARGRVAYQDNANLAGTLNATMRLAEMLRSLSDGGVVPFPPNPRAEG